MFVFLTDRFGGRRVQIPSKITEFTFFLAGNWYRPETGQHTVCITVFVFEVWNSKTKVPAQIVWVLLSDRLLVLHIAVARAVRILENYQQTFDCVSCLNNYFSKPHSCLDKGM